MRKGQGDGDWEPSALELGAKLRKVQRKNTALVAEVKQLKEQLELSREPPPPRPPTPPPRSPGPLWTSPVTGDPAPPPPGSVVSCSGSLWVGWEASRTRFEKREIERAKQEDRDRKKAVRKACGWKGGEEDPVLLRAAMGFWQGTDTKGAAGEGIVAGAHHFGSESIYILPQYNHSIFLHVSCCVFACAGTRSWRNQVRHALEDDELPENRPRCSKKQRVAIFNELLVKGFDGDAMLQMQKMWARSKRFSVVRLAKVSDMDSSFNPTAVGAMRACEGGLGKGRMGLLCGASSTRRRQNKVHVLASEVGWSWNSIHNGLGGLGWCWGTDDEGAFTKGVHLYVKMVYVDACGLYLQERGGDLN